MKLSPELKAAIAKDKKIANIQKQIDALAGRKKKAIEALNRVFVDKRMMLVRRIAVRRFEIKALHKNRQDEIHRREWRKRNGYPLNGPILNSQNSEAS